MKAKDKGGDSGKKSTQSLLPHPKWNKLYLNVLRLSLNVNIPLMPFDEGHHSQTLDIRSIRRCCLSPTGPQTTAATIQQSFSGLFPKTWITCQDLVMWWNLKKVNMTGLPFKNTVVRLTKFVPIAYSVWAALYRTHKIYIQSKVTAYQSYRLLGLGEYE